MIVTLERAALSDCPQIHAMQAAAFQPLLDKYGDRDTNPSAESLGRIIERFEQPFTEYWFILADGEKAGALRVCDFGQRCRLSPIFILPEHQGAGIAQKAMLLMEKQYPAARVWELDTIQQEPGLCHLYEKLGYRATGETRRVKEGMDIVFYEKHME